MGLAIAACSSDQAAGGARKEGTASATGGSGGPRVSIAVAITSVGSDGSTSIVRGSRTGWKTGTATLRPAAGSAARASSIVSTQPQPAAQAALSEVERLEAVQFASRASTGDTQQQNHGVVPQARPSHCQKASACGTKAARSSARSVTTQIVRRNLTPLIIAQCESNCKS